VKTVRAGGGVPWRTGSSGAVEVLVVHRPKYDDWTFPKGKLGASESEEEAAVREVEEETGLRCTLGAELPSAAYRDQKDRPKTVRYWVMHVIGGDFTPNDEVDQVRWLAPEEASGLLSYDHDREVLAGFLAAPH
jgi:8-oxo-dGTP diphosphatase